MSPGMFTHLLCTVWHARGLVSVVPIQLAASRSRVPSCSALTPPLPAVHGSRHRCCADSLWPSLLPALLCPALPCRVKEAMVDSANERIADLKRGVAEAHAAADEARAAADEAEEELAALRCGDADRQDSLRCVGLWRCDVHIMCQHLLQGGHGAGWVWVRPEQPVGGACRCRLSLVMRAGRRWRPRRR